MPREHGQGTLDYREHMTRRRMLNGMAAIGALGVAGCVGDDDEEVDDDDDDVDPDDVYVADPDDAEADEIEIDRPDEDEILQDTFRVRATELPGELNFNTWSEATNFGGVYVWMRDIDIITDPGGGRFHSGDTWTVDYRKGGTQEIEVVSLINDFGITDTTADYNRIWYDINEEAGFTYWDGTPITAEAWEMHTRIGYHFDGGPWDDDTTHAWGIEEDPGELAYYWGGHPDYDADTPPTGNPPFNVAQWHSAPPLGGNPFHPDFTGEWLDQLEDAADEQAHTELIEELATTPISLEDLVENQWGAGAYRVESTDDYSEESIVLHRREDHPRAEQLTIPKLEIMTARRDRYWSLLIQGEIDVASGIIQPDAPPLDENSLPSHFQQIDIWESGGMEMLFYNWNNEHIARRGVRRAIAAAVPWDQARINGWGEGARLPPQYDNGTDAPIARQWYDQEFLDSLYKYPDGADETLATQFMHDSNYEHDGEVWRWEDGEAVELVLLSNTDIGEWLGVTETIREALSAFGMRIIVDNVGGPTYVDRADARQYDILMDAHPASSPWGWLGAHDAGLVTTLYSGELEGDFFRCEPDQPTDRQGIPTEVTVPEEPGELYIENDGYTFNACANARNFYEYDTTTEDLLEIMEEQARFWNFELPHYQFTNMLEGYAGNVRDFDWPVEGQVAHTIGAPGAGSFQFEQGIVRATTDDSF